MKGPDPMTSPDSAPAIESLQTVLLQARRVLLDSSWTSGGLHPHQDPVARLYWPLAGEGFIVCRGRRQRLRPGVLYAIPAHTPFHYGCGRMLEKCYLHFRATLSSCLDPFEVLGWRLSAPCRDIERVNGLWNELLRLQSSGGAAGALAADGILRQLLARLVPANPGGAAMKSELGRFLPVLEYMESHLHQRITLAGLAGLVYLQPTYFSNLFSEVLGLPPMRYLNRRRVERARALLRRERMSLAEIAARCGFNDQFYLSRVFSRETGMSPSEYRRQKPPEEQGARSAERSGR